jgi:cytochrome b subunit of formate dehydrogenase
LGYRTFVLFLYSGSPNDCLLKDLSDFQINQPTRYISLSDLLLVVQIQLNMFRASSFPSSGTYKLQQQPLVCRWNVVVAVLLVVVGPVLWNPEAATAVYKLLMMSKRMPETC